MGQISEKRSVAILTRSDMKPIGSLRTHYFKLDLYPTLTMNQFAMFFGIHRFCLILASLAGTGDFANSMVVRIPNPDKVLRVYGHTMGAIQKSLGCRPRITAGTTFAVACNGRDQARFQVNPKAPSQTESPTWRGLTGNRCRLFPRPRRIGEKHGFSFFESARVR